MTQTISKKLIALIVVLSVVLSSAVIASVAIIANTTDSTVNAGSVMMTTKMRHGVHGATYMSTDGSIGA
uniref:hypothetical protein n=1 Tax=Mobiluncus mulieris TaxID=2052 RepID=UPI00242B1340